MPVWRFMAVVLMVPVCIAAAIGLVWATGWRGETAGLVGGLLGFGLMTLAVWLLWDPDAPAQLSRLFRRVRGPA